MAGRLDILRRNTRGGIGGPGRFAREERTTGRGGKVPKRTSEPLGDDYSRYLERINELGRDTFEGRDRFVRARGDINALKALYISGILPKRTMGKIMAINLYSWPSQKLEDAVKLVRTQIEGIVGVIERTKKGEIADVFNNTSENRKSKRTIRGILSDLTGASKTEAEALVLDLSGVGFPPILLSQLLNDYIRYRKMIEAKERGDKDWFSRGNE